MGKNTTNLSLISLMHTSSTDDVYPCPMLLISVFEHLVSLWFLAQLIIVAVLKPLLYADFQFRVIVDSEVRKHWTG